ncbi:putative gamma-glutamyltranspeptidase 1 precursor [Kockovaella imperatae]|uniref:Glutathione hydrolase n=1 Tax=Kockovaella imperatae TaxID=4999 RepID=A0A1Y1UA00_9TREE|nr:putative gamma-glutamyltranspeptidase 1 precursor [Kockovaella imperatae]ORX34374.1 putative gamma-glutamyltranspeptidase 1 precursor [Kockovaella imperatae]
MPSSSSREAQDRAERERLLPNENERNGPDNQRTPSSWWTPRMFSGCNDPNSVEEDEEDGVPSRYPKRSSSKFWIQSSTYLVILVTGIFLGLVASKMHREIKASRGNGFPTEAGYPKIPPPSGLPRPPAYLVNGTHGAVASEEVTCSNLGLSILKDKNGTAVDAAVTTALCVGLLNAFASGIGGGGFMVIRIPEHSPLPHHKAREAGIWAVDFRETSPAKSQKEMYGEKKAGRVAAQNGGLAIGVPGELRGLEMAHEMYGTLPWEELVMPVAELAKRYQVSRILAKRIRSMGESWMKNFDAWKQVYAPDGQFVVEGDWIARKNYGKTLETIARHGASAFYEGEIAKKSVRTIQGYDGIMDEEDLKSFKARRYPAIHQTYHGKTIYTTSAPTSGGVMLGILNLLEPYNFQESSCLDSHINQHRLVEAMKFGFGARSEVCDPAFAQNASRFDEFYSKEWADAIRPLITDNTTHDYKYYGLVHDTPIDKGTTHLSVVDQWGGAASVTSTVNGIWGSKVMDPETGIIFNNEQDDFAIPGAADQFGLQPSPWNYPAPGKKPLSSTAATIILNDDGSLHAVLGGSGGSRIFPSIVQVILNLECGYDISAAIERPRIHNQIVPQITTIEVGPEGEDKGLSKSLRAKGHELLLFDVNLGIAEVQGVILDNGTLWAASDSRKHGVAAAY